MPNKFYQLNKLVTIAAEEIFVLGFQFCHLFEEDKFHDSLKPSSTHCKAANSLRKSMPICPWFLLRHALMELKFEKVKDIVSLMEMNATTAIENVTVIERKIRHVKEKTRTMTGKYPFAPILIIVFIHTVYSCVFWLNMVFIKPKNY